MKTPVLLLAALMLSPLHIFAQQTERTLQEVAAMPGKYIYQGTLANFRGIM